MSWAEIMLSHEDKYINNIAEFLIELGTLSQSESLDKVLDAIMGTEEELAPDNEHEEESGLGEAPVNNTQEKFLSPFKQYYFSEEKRRDNPLLYLNFLSSLKAFIRAITEYKKESVLKIEDLVKLVELHERNDIPIIDDSKYLSARKRCEPSYRS